MEHTLIDWSGAIEPFNQEFPTNAVQFYCSCFAIKTNLLFVKFLCEIRNLKSPKLTLKWLSQACFLVEIKDSFCIVALISASPWCPVFYFWLFRKIRSNSRLVVGFHCLSNNAFEIPFLCAVSLKRRFHQATGVILSVVKKYETGNKRSSCS